MANEIIKVSSLNDWYSSMSEFYKNIDETKESSSGLSVGSLLTIDKLNKLAGYLNDLNYTSKTTASKRIYFGYADWSNPPVNVESGKLLNSNTYKQLDDTVTELKAIYVANAVTNSQTGDAQQENSTNSNSPYENCATNKNAANSNKIIPYGKSGDSNCTTYSYYTANSNCNQYVWNMSGNSQNVSQVCTNCTDRASTVVYPEAGWDCQDCNHGGTKTCSHCEDGEVCSWTTSTQYAAKEGTTTKYDRTYGNYETFNVNYHVKCTKCIETTCDYTGDNTTNVTNSKAANPNCTTYLQSGNGKVYDVDDLECETTYIGYAVRTDLTLGCQNLNEDGCIQSYVRLPK